MNKAEQSGLALKRISVVSRSGSTGQHGSIDRGSDDGKRVLIEPLTSPTFDHVVCHDCQTERTVRRMLLIGGLEPAMCPVCDCMGWYEVPDATPRHLANAALARWQPAPARSFGF